jgi:hypothetical protein
MAKSTPNNSGQLDIFEIEESRSLLGKLFADSRLYTTREGYKELLDFATKLRNFAPFNAMLLQAQKPGLAYAASAHEWQVRFNRKPKEGARPLLILWPFGPVALVYDLEDTEGDAVPQDAHVFTAEGSINQVRLLSMFRKFEKFIDVYPIDAGSGVAGQIRRCCWAKKPTEYSHYRLNYNKNHPPAVQFATLAHELGHLFLGHLGPDKKLRVSDRSRSLPHASEEVEAESVAYLVCSRNNVNPNSDSYLSDFLKDDKPLEHIDIYHIMSAAGRVEYYLGLTINTSFCLSGKTI